MAEAITSSVIPFELESENQKDKIKEVHGVNQNSERGAQKEELGARPHPGVSHSTCLSTNPAVAASWSADHFPLASTTLGLDNPKH